MNLDLQKLLSALGDLVTIMIPGMVLFAFGMYFFGGSASDVFKLSSWYASATEVWLAVIVASYLIGHLIYLPGSLLDSWIYDRIRRQSKLGFISVLADGDHPEFDGLAAKLSRRFFGDDPDKAVSVAERLKAAALNHLGAAESMNAYKWCRARLLKENPEGYAAVARFEADSKFFRSLTVMLPVLMLLALVACKIWMILVALPLVLLAMWRYIEQRFKATEEAYQQVIALDARERAKQESGVARSSEARVGAVVYTSNGREPCYLLVQAALKRDEWVLPKGHVEPGEDHRKTAVREVLEETGIWARTIERIEDLKLDPASTDTAIPVYLLKCVKPLPAQVLGYNVSGQDIEKAVAMMVGSRLVWPENRAHIWCTLEIAQKLASFEETRALLADVAGRLRARRADHDFLDG